MFLTGQTVSGVSNRLLLRVLTNQQEIRQTLTTLSVMMQSVLSQLNLTNGLAAAQLPEGISFPMTTVHDVDDVEDKLKDSATKTVLVTIEFNMQLLLSDMSTFPLLAEFSRFSDPFPPSRAGFMNFRFPLRWLLICQMMHGE